MGHYFSVVFPFSGNVSPLLRIVLMSSPWSGVWIFFTLSGYLMGKGFARGRYTLDEAGSRLFLSNRLFRIAPIYYCGILIVSLYRYTAIFEWRHWWMLLEMFLFDYRGDLPMNPIGALWSVSTEVQFYVLVPLLMVMLLRVRERIGSAFPVVPVLLVCAGTAVRVGLTHLSGLNTYSYGYAPLLTNLDLFIAGMSINLIPSILVPAALRAKLGPILAVSGICFYVAISAATFYEARLHLGNFWAKGPFLCGSFAMFFIYLAEARGRVAIGRGWIGKSLIGLQTMGTLTYCLYVFHPEVFIANGALLPRIISVQLSLAHFPMVMLELVGLASFFYFAVEKPFDTRKKVSGAPLDDPP
jgi:peptidoglycan/LPS O-acetylase OafA/YrhL